MPEVFAVGDTVVYNDSVIGRPVKCRITKVMPREHGASFYHIRDVTERHERSVPGNTLARRVPDADSNSVFAAN